MTAQELLAFLQQQGIELWMDDDKLRYRGLRSTLPPALVALLRQYKKEVRALLKERSQSRPDEFPLSHTQKAFWFLYQLNPQSSAYIGAFAVRLRGPVSIRALTVAFEQLANRHPTLRASLVVREGVPWQHIAAHAASILTLIDARSWSPVTLITRVQADAQRPFDLLAEAPAQLCLYQCSARESVLLLRLHHIYVDGWSLAILIRELGTLYRSAVLGQTPQLPPQLGTYADFVRWQQQLLLSPAGEAQLGYWLSALSGCTPVLELPYDRPRPPNKGELGARISWPIDAALTQKLRALAAQESTTLYTVLLTLFAVLLYRYTGQEDILIGSPFHGRSDPRFNDVVGCFINSVALRVSVRGQNSVRELLAAVRQITSESLARADYPLPILVEKLRLPRDPSRSPLFQVLFSFENFFGAEVFGTSPPIAESDGRDTLFGVPLEPIVLQQQDGQLDLGLSVTESPSGIACTFSYSTDLFDASTVQRLAEHYEMLLHSATADPHREAAQLGLIPREEYHRLTVAWNQTARPFAEEARIHQLFEAQVERTPDAIAVSFSDQQLTYRELDERANQLAHYLCSLGVGPESLVGVFIERSLAMVVGLLGVLKAGGAYLPLDPAYPVERLASMLADAQPAVVLFWRKRANLATRGTTQWIDLQDPAGLLVRQPTHSPALPGRATELAYVIYTSGSTGRPKGVEVTHRSLVNHATAMAQRFGLTAGDRVLQFASLNFDVAAEELYPTWMSGGTVVLRTEDAPISIADFVTFLGSQRIDIANLPTAFWQQWVVEQAHLTAPIPAPLRLVIIGGEAALAERVLKWRALVGDRIALLNAYGPTETTVTATDHLFTSSSVPTEQSPVPIGRPIANTRAYLLDEQRQLVPQGVAGELYLGGAGLARGYRNQPAVTAEKFVPSPLPEEPGLLYRTGDLCRYRGDGELEYLGRTDHQIKLRGFRIELGEIESQLALHPDVQACVVVLREDSPGDRRLVAYIVPEPGRSPVIASLRQHLGARLPEHMLPATFVVLATLPLMPNGKIARKALPAPRKERGPDVYQAPRTPVEQMLADFFAELLQLDRAGIHDNFFLLGGHSLLALRLMARIGQRTGKLLPLSTLFQHPTIAELAPRLHNNAPGAAEEPVVALQKAGTRRPLFCVHPVGGNVLCYLELGRALGTEQPLYGIQATGLADPDAAAPETLEALAARYVVAIRQVQPQPPYQLLGWSLGGVLVFEMARQLCAANQAVAQLILIDAYTPELLRQVEPETVDEPYLRQQFISDFLRQEGQTESGSDAAAGPTELGTALLQLHQKGLLPEEIKLPQLTALYEVFRRNLQLMRAYHPGSYPGPMVLVRAAQGDSRDAAGDHGWAALCSGTLEIIELPGNHYTLLAPPQVQALAQQVALRLTSTTS